MTFALHAALRSDVGHVRDGNEDAGYGSPRLVAVADGMGGQAAGEVAAKIAIARLAALDDGPPGPDPLGALQGAVLTANQDLRDFVSADPDLEGMGTTVTALLADGERVALAHIGDSRAYLLRDGALRQVTHDHTYVQTLIDDGQLSPDEAALHPQRSLLIRALDGRPGVELDISTTEGRPGDRYLLCTDGLSGVVAEDTIATALSLPSVEEAAEKLIELALRGGGPDNITVVVADLVEVDGSPRRRAEQPVVAGAAAEGPAPVRPATGAAARAAQAIRRSGRGRQVADRRSDRRRLLGTVVLPVAALVVIGLAILGTWLYVQTQYYVGVSGNRVAIYHGISGSVGPIHLSSVEQLAMPVHSLQPYARDQVQDGISASSLAGARSIVVTLRADEIPPSRPKHRPAHRRPTHRTKHRSRR